MFYATPIIYPVGFLPPWARDLAFLNPFTQILQDIRAIVLYPELARKPHHRRPMRSRPAGSIADRDHDRDLGRWPLHVPARGALVRGARVMAGSPAVEVERRTQVVPAPAPAANDRQGASSSTRSGRRDYERQNRPRRRLVLGRARRVLRNHRRERKRQEHTAEDHRRHLPRKTVAPFECTVCSRRSSSSASASTAS